MTVFEKIASQQGKERSAVWMVGEQLKEIISHEPHLQEIVSQDLDVAEMSLAKCEEKIKEFADKNKTGNFSCVTPIEAEKIIREFYGLNESESSAPSTAPLTLESFFG
jgi:septation ring formation regulator EzrA